MNIQIKSSNGISVMPIETRLLAIRKVFVEGEIDSSMAFEFVKQILYLNQEDNSAPIDVLINSPGGEINSGMLMYDVIQSSKAPIHMYCLGRAYSMAAVLFASGNHGRYILPHSELMIHEPLLGNRVGGSTSSLKSISDSLLEVKRKMNQILAKHTGRSEEEIEQATSYDHYLSPDEAIAFGLCDKVVDIGWIMEGWE